MTASDIHAETVPGTFDEAAELTALQRDAKALVRKIEPLTKLKPGSAKAIEQLDAAMSSFPDVATLTAVGEEIRSRAARILESAGQGRAHAFRHVEAEFIADRRQSGSTPRELASGWRIDEFELEARRDRGQARVLYNREVVVPWTPVAAREHLDALLEEARRRLQAHAIEESALSSVLLEAYEHLARRRGGTTVRIPLPDFFREVRVAAVRYELERAGRADRRLSRPDVPRWAFLYNLDRYRLLAASLPESMRLQFETGSQHDHQRGMAMVLNGLDQAQDYKSYAYVYLPVDSRT